MNDETKAALARFRATMADERTQMDEGTFNALWGDDALILAHVDGFDARLAAAREEQREACAQYVGAEFDLDVADESVRHTPLTATPLADRITFLDKLSKDRLVALEATLDREDHQRERTEKAEAERDKLRRWPCEHFDCDLTLGDIDDAPSGDDEPHPDGRVPYWFCGGCWNAELTKVCAERDALRAQVDRLRTDLANADAAEAVSQG